MKIYLDNVLSASGDDRRTKLEDFRRKEVSCLKNNKFQCFQTAVLHPLLQNGDFRNAVAEKLETAMPLLEQHVVNAHLFDNEDEDWLYKIACDVDESFANANRQHDAAEFLDLLLTKLDIPSELFELKTHVDIKCQGAKCAMRPFATYTEKNSLSGRFVDL